MPRRRTLIATAFLSLAVVACALVAMPGTRAAMWSILTQVRGRATIEERLAQLTDATERIRARCVDSELAFPPSEVTLVAIKDARLLRVLGKDSNDWKVVAEFPILGASGVAGPKLASGDRQVPEGIYPIESLNPNSMFHVALRVGYPNAFDRANGAADGRTDLGGDIMVHGGSASIGCIAVGDAAAEELFVLAARTGIARTRIVIVPSLLVSSASIPSGAPAWVSGLYDDLRSELDRLNPSP